MAELNTLPHLLPLDGMIRRDVAPRTLQRLLDDWKAWLAVHSPAIASRVAAYLNCNGPYVYFIESGPGGPIKIGVSSCVGTRMYDMQISNPDKLACLLTISGGGHLELMFHNVLRESRIRGEWFRRSVELDVFIALASRRPGHWGRSRTEAA